MQTLPSGYTLGCHIGVMNLIFGGNRGYSWCKSARLSAPRIVLDGCGVHSPEGKKASPSRSRLHYTQGNSKPASAIRACVARNMRGHETH